MSGSGLWSRCRIYLRSCEKKLQMTLHYYAEVMYNYKYRKGVWI